MSEITRCPSCERELKLPEDLAGKRVRCPQCAATFTAAPPAPLPASTSRPPPDAYERRSRRRRFHDDYDDEDEDDFDFGRPSRFDYHPHRGAVILTLGILSLAVCGIMGPIAWIMGNMDMREIRSGRMDPSGEGLTNAGRICGIIATCFTAAIVLIYGFMFLMLGAAGMGFFG
jgi:hypothetical protein